MKSSREFSHKHASRSRDVAFLAITFAIMILLQLFSSLLQKLGMPMSLALGLIPVLAVSQTHGVKFGALCGFAFGLFTLVFSVIYMAAIPMYAVTANPLVSVFPRIMTGVVCALSFKGLIRAMRKRDREPSVRKNRLQILSASCASAILGTLTNTVLFLGMFFAFAHGKTFDNLVIDFKWVLTSIVALNTVIELILFAVTVPAIVYAMTQSKLAAKLNPSVRNFGHIQKTGDEEAVRNSDMKNDVKELDNVKEIDNVEKIDNDDSYYNDK